VVPAREGAIKLYREIGARANCGTSGVILKPTVEWNSTANQVEVGLKSVSENVRLLPKPFARLGKAGEFGRSEAEPPMPC